ncbi:hypothetical protein MTP99_003511 [Tenebrio molitor]|nr:hypothetical protein MTP99_003511 [Tenebrio molitor]
MFVSLFFTRDLVMSVKKTMQKIVDIDVSLTKLVQKQYLERRNHRVRRYGIKLLLTINLVFNTLGSVYNAYCKKSDQYLYFFITWYPRVVVSTKLIGYLTVITTIRTRLEVINNLLLLEVVESNKLKKFPVKHDFGEYIDGLVTLHKDLIRTSQELADSFSPFLLVWISTHFVILLGDSYAGFNVILNDNPVKHLNVVIGLVKNCIGYAVDLYALSVKSSDLCREAATTKTALLGIKIDVVKEDERNTVIASALRLMENKLEVTACKLFRIDNALLFSICSAVFSYLFVMLQFDRSTDKSLQATNTTRS